MDFINLGIQSKQYDPYVQPDDKLCIVDSETGRKYHGNVSMTKFNSRYGQHKGFDVDFKDMYDINRNIDLGTTVHQRYNHTQEPLSKIAKEINQQDSKFKLSPEHSHLKETVARTNYPDYPYEPIRSYNKNQKGDYDIRYGRIVDPKLAHELGTDRIFYEKALHNFTPNAGNNNSHTQKGAMAVYKGSVSGPMVTSKNLKVRKMQVKSIIETANSPVRQNFWLDNNSRLLGAWQMPTNTVMRNSTLSMANLDNHVNNAWLNDTIMAANGNASLHINNCGFNGSDLISQRSKDKYFPIKLNYEDSTLSGVRGRINQGGHDFYNSYMENAHIGNNVALKNTTLANLNDTDHPSEFENLRANNINISSTKPAVGFNKIIENPKSLFNENNKNHGAHGDGAQGQVAPGDGGEIDMGM